jgi:predicted  nucleic acid-binding Zn-ribbon protein
MFSKSLEGDMAVRWDINLGTVTTIVAALAGAGIWVNTQITEMQTKITNSENFRVARTAQTDQNFVELRSTAQATQEVQTKQAAQVENLLYRMGQLEANMSAANSRMDRIADSVLGAVDSLKKDVNGINTQVQLLGQKVDALDVPRTPQKRTGLMPPEFAEYIHTLRQQISFREGRPFP